MKGIFVKYIVFIILLFMLVSCSNSLIVKPLEKDKSALNVNLGGPILKVHKVNLPLPLLSFNYAYGVDSNLTFVNNFYLTSAFFGVFHNDIGILYNVSNQKDFLPGISILPHLAFMTNFNLPDTRLFPSLYINSYWFYNDFLFYTGTNIIYEGAKRKAFNQKITNRFLLSPHLGMTYFTKNYNYTLEFKYLLPNISNENIVVDYNSFSNYGAVGIYFSFGINL